MKIGFTGTRNGMTQAQKDELARISAEEPTPSAFHHGDCLGADLEAFTIFKLAGIHTESHPPEDSRLRAFTQSSVEHLPLPYLERNRRIVDSTDLLVACPAGFWETPRGGTWYTIRYARSVGKHLIIIWRDGRVEVELGKERR